MARINRDDVERVASLAKLSLSDEEAETLAAELGSLLDHFEALQEIDTNGIAPTSHPIPLPTPMRDDRAVVAMDPELAVANAPESAGTAFVVPKVVDSESEG
jgi:aspartyl-tRNA(Asn)/glutamyl-tRNA(Gln) amidotransferase subunit C